MPSSQKSTVAAVAAVSAAVVGCSQTFVQTKAVTTQPVQLRGSLVDAQNLATGASSGGSSSSTALLGLGLVAGAAGFSKRRACEAQAVQRHAFENELGVQAPVGFWDPAGFTADGNSENFARRRQTELKHGRVSMLATMGYITPEITGKLPGYLSPSAGLKFADIPNGLAAISKVPAAGWAQIVAYGAYCELSQDQSPGTAASKGDFGFKVLTASDPAEKTKKLAAELANGRLAMMAIIGMFFQDGLTGSAWGDWALYTASPLR